MQALKIQKTHIGGNDVLEKQNESNDVVINTVLQDVLAGNFYHVSKTLASVPDSETYLLLRALVDELAELNEFCGQLAKGNLSARPPEAIGHLGAKVKTLQSKLKYLVWQMGQVAQGDYNHIVQDMGDLSKDFNWMVKQLQLRSAQTAYSSKHDGFTGLLNRASFIKEVKNVIRTQPHCTGAMICIGMDNLKHINNLYGHDTGDRHMLEIANGLAKAFVGKGLLARISGNEFAAYTHGYTNAENAMASVRQSLMHSATSRINDLQRDDISTLSSKGVAIYPDDAQNVTDLIKYSTYAMYEIKNQDRGHIGRYNKAAYIKQVDLFKKLEALSRLIEQKSIRFAFQPIVDLRDGSVYGYEALMRSTTPEFTSPTEILQTAEIHSKLSQIEQLTYETIFEWMDQNMQILDGKKIFFNAVGDNFYNSDKFQNLRCNYKHCMPHMVFEILESAADESAFIDELDMLRKGYGLNVAIDDYGCGYSNDFRLLSMSPNILKVDRFFIQEIQDSPDKQTIVSNLLSFCSTKGIKVLAEGVETKSEMSAIRELGFNFAQGFYLAKPAFDLQIINPEIVLC